MIPPTMTHMTDMTHFAYVDVQFESYTSII
jgi:hypothetical protein